MIPKIIHYIWLGGKPLTQLAEKCIESWKKYCPDYKIMRWDETNFDINQNQYCKQAFDNQKWAFASDYIRLKALYEYGGIYIDTDVEVVKPMDKFLQEINFFGFEQDKSIATAVIGAEKNSELMQSILKEYDNKNFIKDDGSFDYTTNVELITNKIIKIYPEFKPNNTLQQFNNITIYTKDYFCPIDYTTKKFTETKNTHAIHRFAGSWVPKNKSFKEKLKSLIIKVIGKDRAIKLKQKFKKNK